MSCGGRCEVAEEELATAAARVAREVKLSVAVGLRKFIFTNIFYVECCLLVGHTARPLFDNFTTVDLTGVCVKTVKGER